MKRNRLLVSLVLGTVVLAGCTSEPKYDCNIDGHVWIADHENDVAPTHLADGSNAFVCEKCGDTKTEPVAKTTEHTYGSWSKFDEDQHQRVCACGETEKANHNWDSGEITTQPTHTSTGVKTYTCSDCHATKTETVAKIAEHSYGSWIEGSEATCEDAGTKGHYECACGMYFDESYVELKDLVIPAKGHDYVKHEAQAPTVSATGNIEYYSCSRCPKVFLKEGNVYTETTIEGVTIAKLKQFTVTFDTDGGDPIESLTVVEGTKASELESIIPTKTGYDFVKWQLVDGDELIDLTGEEEVESNVVVKAVWKIKVFTVTLVFDNGEDNAELNVNYGTLASELPTPTKAHCDFEGWYLNDTKIKDTDIVTQSMTLTANWTNVGHRWSWDRSATDKDVASCSDCTETLTFNKAVTNTTQEFVLTDSKFALDLSGVDTYKSVVSIKVGDISLGVDPTNLDMSDLIADTSKHGNQVIKVVVLDNDTESEHTIEVPVLFVTKEIATESDLLSFVALNTSTTKSEAYSYNGYYRLVADIVADGTEIGGKCFNCGNLMGIMDTVYNSNYGFLGTFDGNGHVLSGFKFTQGGLFGDLGKGSVVKNLSLIATISDKAWSSALATVNNGTIDNCYFEIDATGGNAQYCGVISIGAKYATIKNTIIDAKTNVANKGQFKASVYAVVANGAVTSSLTISNVTFIDRSGINTFIDNANIPTGVTRIDATSYKAKYQVDISTTTSLALTYSDLFAGEGTITSVVDLQFDRTKNLLSNGNVVLASSAGKPVVPYGERTYLVTSSKGEQVIIEVDVITKSIGTWDDLHNFLLIRSEKYGKAENPDQFNGYYDYGWYDLNGDGSFDKLFEREYYVLTADISTTNWVRGWCYKVSAITGFIAADMTEIGFKGTFNGQGHIINAKYAFGGLFGDLGEGSVVKNVAFKGTMIDQARSVVLGVDLYKCTIDNCYFEVDGTGHTQTDGGIVCISAGSITFKNSILYNKGSEKCGNFSFYANRDADANGPSSRIASQRISNVIMAYRSSQANYSVNNNLTTITGVTQIDCSSEALNYDGSYTLTGFSSTGFDKNYWNITTSGIPQWKGLAA